MYKILININQKDYFNCSMFYIRKYISARELIFLGILLFVALLFWITLGNILIFAMFVITLGLMGFAVLLFITTALSGYRADYGKRNITKQLLIFYEWGFTVDSYNNKEEKVFTEKYFFNEIDKVALRKDRVYIYAGVATHYYIFPEFMTEGKYEDFRLFLINNIDKSKFKMKTRIRQFPYYPKRKFDKDMKDKMNKTYHKDNDKSNE